MQTRYRLGVARKTEAGNADTVSRPTHSGASAIRPLLALPLRMFIGTLDILEEQIHKTAEALRADDPLDERLVELERRVDSLETQATTGRRTSATARRRTKAAASVEPEHVAPRPGRRQEAPETETAAGQSGPESQQTATTESVG